MNIFVIESDPVLAGLSLCNKHIVKMPIETAQLLCTAVKKLSGVVGPYRSCYENHPCGIWTRKSSENFDWLVEHGLAICEAYTIEYGKAHKSRGVILWAKENKPKFSESALTPHPQCVPEKFKSSDAVEAYRNYYIEEKSSFAKWNKREEPLWFRKRPDDFQTR